MAGFALGASMEKHGRYSFICMSIALLLGPIAPARAEVMVPGLDDDDIPEVIVWGEAWPEDPFWFDFSYPEYDPMHDRYSEPGGGGGPGGTAGTNSARLEPDAGNEGDPDCGQQATMPKTGHPVVIATGAKVQREEDFSSKGEVGLRLTRTYGSAVDAAVGLFGPKWVSDFDYKLGLSGTSSKECLARPGVQGCSLENKAELYRYSPDGARYTYDFNGTKYIASSDPNSLSYIAKTASGFVYHDADGHEETYDFGGTILNIKNRAGIGWFFNYDSSWHLLSVSHTSGRAVHFSWNGGKVGSVTDPNGNVYYYSYNSDGYLSNVTYPGSTGSRTYYYEDSSLPGFLTGIAVNGVRYSNYSYYSGGKAKESGLANGIEKSTFSYGTNTTTVTNALGAQAVYTFSTGPNGQKRLSSVTQSASSCPSAAAHTYYDSNGHIDYTLDWLGNKTDYSYNAAGQLLSVTTGINAGSPGRERRTDYTYTSANQIETMTVFGPGSVQLSKSWYTYIPEGSPGGTRIYTIATTNFSNNGIYGQYRTTRYAYTTYENGLLNTVAAR